MPPRRLLGLGPALNTRAANKTVHPGAPDLPNPRRLPSEMEALRQEEAEAAKQKEFVLARAAKNLASVEDGIHNEDIVREKERVEGYKSIEVPICAYFLTISIEAANSHTQKHVEESSHTKILVQASKVPASRHSAVKARRKVKKTVMVEVSEDESEDGSGKGVPYTYHLICVQIHAPAHPDPDFQLEKDNGLHVEDDMDSDVDEEDDTEVVGKKRKRKTAVSRKDITALRTTAPATKKASNPDYQNGA